MVTKEPTEALKKIVVSLSKKDGFRHLWLGNSGMGKTVANKKLVSFARKHGIDLVLSVDDKNMWEVQYDGTYRVNPAHLKEHPPHDKEDAGHIVFRGHCYSSDALKSGARITSEDTAQMAWDLVCIKPCQILVNIDELADAVTPNSQVWDGHYVPQVYRKGRGVGISITATTQMPQMLPREAFGLSDTIGIFRMTAREAEYLVKYRIIEKTDVETIATLQVGQWMLYDKASGGFDNQTFYKFGGIK